MCQNCPNVVTVLLAYVLTWQLFCDICPRGFHLKGHWLTYQIELIIKYWYDWISFNLIWNRIPSLKNSQQWPKKNALTKCNISINEPRPSWTSDLAYSCPRDWRLSASGGLIEGSPLNPSAHHSAEVPRGFRDAPQWCPHYADRHQPMIKVPEGPET